MSTTITPTEQNIEINVNNDVIDINVTNEIVDVNATTQQIDINVAGAYPIPNPVLSVFGRTGVVVATEGDYTLTQLGDVTLSSPSNGQVLKYNGTAWVNSTDADTGITTLNTLTALSQTFATGTSGTDFNISSATSTHTFNIPTASAINRGLLSSTDWTTFNNKQDTITNPVTGTGTANTIPLWNATSNITNSVITQVSGNIRVGSTTQTSKLNVGGDIDLSGVLKNNGTQIINVGSGSLALGDGTGKLTTSDIIVNTSPFTITIGSSFVPYAFTNFGSITGSSFIRSGGTSSQFLKADGSVDSTAYGTGSVTSVAALTIGTSGTDLSSTVANSTTTPVITLNVPTASATNRGALSSADWTTFNNKQSALTNPITGTGTSGQVAYFNGTTSLTSNAAFAFTPTSQLLINNSVTAASAIARGTNLTPTLTAAANNDVLVGLDINPTFTNGAFTGVSNLGLRVQADATFTKASGNMNFNVSSVAASTIFFSLNTGTSALSFNVRGSGSTGNMGLPANSAEIAVFQKSAFGIVLNQSTYFAIGSSLGEQLRLVSSTGNLLLNTITDAGFRLDVNGTARTQQLHSFLLGTLLDSTSASNFYSVNTGGSTYGGLALRNQTQDYTGYIQTGRSGNANGINFFHTTFAGATSGDGHQKFSSTAVVFGSLSKPQTLTIYKVGGSAGTAQYPLVLNNQINTTNTGVGLIFQTGNETGGGPIDHANITAYKTNLGGGFVTSNLRFFTISDGANTLSEKMRISDAGNLLVGTTTDGPNQFTLGGSETASSAIARGGLINTTLVASANNDVLVGLDINPTFTNGAFTGVANIGARIQNSALLIGASLISTSVANFALQINLAAATGVVGAIRNSTSTGYSSYRCYNDANRTLDIGYSGSAFSGPVIGGGISGESGWLSTVGAYPLQLGTNNSARFTIFSSGTIGINTATDAGFRLDVNGTARVQGQLTTTADVSINSVSVGLGGGAISTNIRVGASALASNTTGIKNTALGNRALRVSSTNDENTSIGYESFDTLTTGSYNVAIGSLAGRYFTGTNSITSCSSSIFIGYFTKALADSQTNQIVIGTGTTGLGSNTTVLGNASTTLTALYGAVITGGTSVNASAQLQVDSTTKGFLPPRMTTTQRTAISSPATGLIVYDTTLNKLSVYTGSAWETVTSI